MKCSHLEWHYIPCNAFQFSFQLACGVFSTNEPALWSWTDQQDNHCYATRMAKGNQLCVPVSIAIKYRIILHWQTALCVSSLAHYITFKENNWIISILILLCCWRWNLEWPIFLIYAWWRGEAKLNNTFCDKF